MQAKICQCIAMVECLYQKNQCTVKLFTPSQHRGWRPEACTVHNLFLPGWKPTLTKTNIAFHVQARKEVLLPIRAERQNHTYNIKGFCWNIYFEFTKKYYTIEIFTTDHALQMYTVHGFWSKNYKTFLIQNNMKAVFTWWVGDNISVVSSIFGSLPASDSPPANINHHVFSQDWLNEFWQFEYQVEYCPSRGKYEITESFCLDWIAIRSPVRSM